MVDSLRLIVECSLQNSNEMENREGGRTGVLRQGGRTGAWREGGRKNG